MSMFDRFVVVDLTTQLFLYGIDHEGRCSWTQNNHDAMQVPEKAAHAFATACVHLYHRGPFGVRMATNEVMD